MIDSFSYAGVCHGQADFTPDELNTRKRSRNLRVSYKFSCCLLLLSVVQYVSVASIIGQTSNEMISSGAFIYIGAQIYSLFLLFLLAWHSCLLLGSLY